MKKWMVMLAVGLSAPALLAQTSAPTEPPPAAPGPSLDLASLAAKAAIDACTARGFKVGVSIVDSAGVLKVLLAQDGTSARGVQSSTNKAVTSLTFKDATSHLGERAKSDTAFAQSVSADPALNIRAGGVLLKAKDQIVGAIGVGGARGSENDEACAIVGVEAIQQRLNAQVAAP
jgi:uncharacterized protein GlcG (DUF336 family)